jgi:hypothetical protein
MQLTSIYGFVIMVFNINVCVSLTSSVLSQLGVNEPSLVGSGLGSAHLFLGQART